MEPNTTTPQAPATLTPPSVGPLPVSPVSTPVTTSEPIPTIMSAPDTVSPTAAPVRVSAEPMPTLATPSSGNPTPSLSSSSFSEPRLAPPLAPTQPPISAPSMAPSASTPSLSQASTSFTNPVASAATMSAAPSDVDIAKLDELKQRLEDLKLQTGIAPAPMTPQANQMTASNPSPNPGAPAGVRSATPNAEITQSVPPQAIASQQDVTPAASITDPESLTMGSKLPDTTAELPKKHSSKPAIILILVIALLAVGGFIAYTVLNRPTPPQQIINTESPTQEGQAMMEPPAVTTPEAINMEEMPVSDDTSMTEPPQEGTFPTPIPMQDDTGNEVLGIMDETFQLE